MRDLIGRLTTRLSLDRGQVERTVALFDQENTVPFIARYRKEVTAGLDEEQLDRFRRELDTLRALAARQQTVLHTIEEQGKLSEPLAEAIERVETMQELEDLYRPYKPKRRTRAQVAREKGLEPLAMLILSQSVPSERLESLLEAYLTAEVLTPDDALAGARDIVAEAVSDDPRSRALLRELYHRRASLVVVVADAARDEKKVYQTYYEFSSPFASLRPHQVLAINRGEAEEVLLASFDLESEGVSRVLRGLYKPEKASPFSSDLFLAVEESVSRLLMPSIEREMRAELTREAEAHAISVFRANLRGLLLTPPIKGAVVIGLDPGYRTGTKLAVVDETGKVLATATIYPHAPRKQWADSLAYLQDLVDEFKVTLLAIGNGTASRETEELAAALILARPQLRYLMVSEAGASVYSASPLARAELPDLDVTLRGAVSIARRAQDPLAELVKIDPRSIGVGMYQHDVDQKELAEALDDTVRSVVNAVGVDANTASPALLQYVAGFGPKLAESFVAYRDAHGGFTRREDFLKVKGMGARTFEQAAGFLRVAGGDNPLDNTGIHPESYMAVRKLLRLLGLSFSVTGFRDQLLHHQKYGDHKAMAESVGVGLPTLRDIFAELLRPGRDPREDVPPPVLRGDVLKMEDLVPGMRLKGTVRNVVDFGAFVDIGVKQDGLVHVSEMSDRRVKSPYEVLNVGDVIEVAVLDVDIARGRISLTLKGVNNG